VPPAVTHSARAGARLWIGDEAGVTRERPVTDRALPIGRVEGTDIRIPARFVLASHARVEPDGAAHRIADLGSTSGLLRAGERLSPHRPRRLMDGDPLRISDWTTSSFVTLTYRTTHAARATLRPRDPLGSSALLIGRARPGRVLDQPFLSRRHAAVVPGTGGYVLRDLGSTNGTFVNGRRVAQHALQPGEIIQIGAAELLYHSGALERCAAPGTIARRVEPALADVDRAVQRATPFGRRPGGERRRARSAAELLADPPLLLLDESTADLDPRLEKKLLFTLRRLADAGRTLDHPSWLILQASCVTRPPFHNDAHRIS
jgi:pSer/pThr/pTyr-binding forkhead associated (FHA) protein